MTEKKTCYSCAYCGTIPGSCHASCTYAWSNDEKMPAGDTHGIKNGWYMFPFNYDPVWMDEECTAHAKETDPSKVVKDNPIFTLASLLGKRLL